MSPRTDWRRNRIVRPLGIVAILALLTVGAWQLFWAKQEFRAVSVEFKGVMGADAQIVAIVPTGQEALADEAIRTARAEFGRVEGLMSAQVPRSEISVFNDAPAGQLVKLSRETLDLLRLSCQLAADTHGAFDVTCRPLLLMWRKARDRNQMPTQREIADARAKSGWDKIELLQDGARKKTGGASVDLGDIARGYAVDLAVDAMRRAGVAGGLVRVGGHIRVFGSHGGGDVWTVPVPDPFGGDKPLATVRVRDAAICTCVNYGRPGRVGQRRVGQVVDPRTGEPADVVASATVVGSRAVSGAWAAALSVLGAPGLDMLPKDGTEAMVVTGDKGKHQTHASAGFAKLASGETP